MMKEGSSLAFSFSFVVVVVLSARAGVVFFTAAAVAVRRYWRFSTRARSTFSKLNLCPLAMARSRSAVARQSVNVRRFALLLVRSCFGFRACVLPDRTGFAQLLILLFLCLLTIVETQD